MNLKLSTLLLVVCGSVCYSAQDVTLKSNSTVSDVKPLRKRLKSLLPGIEKKESEEDGEYETIPISDLGITVPPEDANDTVQSDHHTYYNSTFYSNPSDARRFWINFDMLPESSVILHEKLSDSYRQATTIELSFDFPFYGNPLRNVTIATGGFLYMGDYLHNWIAATQYIAPLMANFDTRMSYDSVIKYHDNGTAFSVFWDNVFIQNRQSDGDFSFQVTLFKSGDIVFAYKDIPFPVTSISDSQHPVKIGLSDAYIVERVIFYIRRKTVYEYNRIHITNWDISNNTALYFTALKTCNTFKDCSSCLSLGANLDCNWCEALHRCSDGIDRHRQHWITAGCNDMKLTTCPANESSSISDKPEISAYTKIDVTQGVSFTTKPGSDEYTVDQSTNFTNVYESNQIAHYLHHDQISSSSSSTISPGAIITILVFFVSVIAAGVWIFYAYKYPQSSSGQFLIKYRPSQWPLKKKETTITTTNPRHL